jgi:hypothetical protein
LRWARGPPPFLKGLGRPVEEHGELELGCWAGEDRRLIAITEF